MNQIFAIDILETEFYIKLIRELGVIPFLVIVGGYLYYKITMRQAEINANVIKHFSESGERRDKEINSLRREALRNLEIIKDTLESLKTLGINIKNLENNIIESLEIMSEQVKDIANNVQDFRNEIELIKESIQIYKQEFNESMAELMAVFNELNEIVSQKVKETQEQNGKS